jgi:hypothetical protein
VSDADELAKIRRAVGLGKWPSLRIAREARAVLSAAIGDLGSPKTNAMLLDLGTVMCAAHDMYRDLGPDASVMDPLDLLADRVLGQTERALYAEMVAVVRARQT